MTGRIVVRVASVMILIGTLSAGLWPFHAPKNGVAWLSQGGIKFGKHGSVFTTKPFQLVNLTDNVACSLEIWLEPATSHQAGTILAFYEPGHYTVLLALRQSLGDLVMGRGDRDHPQHVRHNRVYIDDVLSGKGPVFITITSGSSGTSVYSNAVLVRQLPNLKLSTQSVAGQLILGNAPSTVDSWSGNLKGLALYARELSTNDVKQHYSDWELQRSTHDEDAVAKYKFDERSGTVVGNTVDPITNLTIPERFSVPNKPFLERPWNEFHPGWSYWEDIAVNVFGFAPLGFFFCAQFYSSHKVGRPAFWAIVLGFAVSLTIEVLQAFLPTRDSGMTDLFTNTFGTALGALTFLRLPMRELIAS
jgi:VanZ like protein/concanavalin A-like lectin/glucanase superfamily protein